MGKPKILIVDDDKENLSVFQNTFQDHFEILTSESPSHALSLLREHPDVAVFIADQRMPEMNGTEILCKVKESHPAITRILITGYADLEAAICAINQGAVYKYISKPFDLDETEKFLKDAVLLHQRMKKEGA